VVHLHEIIFCTLDEHGLLSRVILKRLVANYSVVFSFHNKNTRKASYGACLFDSFMHWLMRSDCMFGNVTSAAQLMNFVWPFLWLMEHREMHEWRSHLFGCFNLGTVLMQITVIKLTFTCQYGHCLHTSTYFEYVTCSHWVRWLRMSHHQNM
jgi:hypothetical protein